LSIKDKKYYQQFYLAPIISQTKIGSSGYFKLVLHAKNIAKIKEILKKRFNKEISQPTIHHKIKKFEKSEIILNYTINFCPKKIGFKGKYILRIKPKDPSKYNDLALKLGKKNEIIDLFRIGEQYGLFAIVRVKNVKDYGKFIKRVKRKQKMYYFKI